MGGFLENKICRFFFWSRSQIASVCNSGLFYVMSSAVAVKYLKQTPGRLIFDSLICLTSQFKNLH